MLSFDHSRRFRWYAQRLLPEMRLLFSILESGPGGPDGWLMKQAPLPRSYVQKFSDSSAHSFKVFSNISVSNPLYSIPSSIEHSEKQDWD